MTNPPRSRKARTGRSTLASLALIFVAGISFVLGQASTRQRTAVATLQSTSPQPGLTA